MRPTTLNMSFCSGRMPYDASMLKSGFAANLASLISSSARSTSAFSTAIAGVFALSVASIARS